MNPATSNSLGASSLAADLQGLWERQVAATPDAVAIASSDVTITYANLNSSANRLARLLSRLGAVPEGRVGVCLRPGTGLYLAILSIVKSGAAFVPIRHDLPSNRQKKMLEASGAQIALVDSATQAVHVNGPLQILALNDAVNDASREDSRDVGLLGSPEDLFSIIYTSGSTGSPKGVMVTRRGVANQIADLSQTANVGPGDFTLLHRPFDVIGAAWDFFGTLCFGATAIAVSEDDAHDPAALNRIIIKNGISLFSASPSLLEVLLKHAEHRSEGWSALRMVVTGGECVSPQLVEKWGSMNSHATLLNVYGATECLYIAKFNTALANPGAMRIPVGTPCADVLVRLIDENGRDVSVGEAGEVLVASPSLARGYLDDPTLTAKRFSEAFVGSVGERCYLTGDWAVMNADGDLELLGRLDNQVKILGHRLQLEELDIALCRLPGVGAAASVARPDHAGDLRLLAFVVREAGAPSLGELRSDLMGKYPSHMVPAALFELDEIPRTASGKIDRQALLALPNMQIPSAAVGSTSTNAIENRLLAIWREVLAVEDIGLDEHFFDCGGDSLQGMRLLSEIDAEFGIEIALATFFQRPTIRLLAIAIEQQMAEE